MSILKLLKVVLGSSSGKTHAAPTTDGTSATKPKTEPLDKAIDLVQEHLLKQGSQKNQTEGQKAKDKQIADTIKKLYKRLSGKELPGHSSSKVL